MGRADLISAVIAKRVREVRQARRLRQADIGDQTVISKIESGERRVTVEDVVALALALGVSPAHLLVPRNEDQPVLVGTQVESAETWWMWFIGQAALPGQDARTYRVDRPEAVAAGDPHTIAHAVATLEEEK